MNAYKFNSSAQFHLRKCIADSLQIDMQSVYKVVDNISTEGLIQTKDGKIYRLELKRVL